jgi:NAD(P)-dependent dehydrogenase (short-subunit alcohol dehydrogenase family)
MPLDALTAIVTGGGGGIGRAVSDALAAGARVIVTDIDHAAAMAAAAPLAGARAFAHDVTDEEAWIGLLDQVERDAGGIDVLVNAAGIYRPNIAFEDMPLATWRAHIAINLDGTFLGCKHAILRMRRRGGGGAIVNIGSGMSITANPAGAAYCASKAAAAMTTRTAARAAGRYGIRVNAVLPGAVETDMLMGNLAPGDDPAAYLAAMAEGGALGRLASVEDIAAGVLFLADPAQRAITGVCLPIDGGNIPGG